MSTNGTLVTALNPWAQTFVSPTVNGVNFTGWAPPLWNGGVWDLMAGSSSGDIDYDDMLDSARWTGGPTGNPSGWGGIQLDTLGTLTIGQSYEIQIWYSDQRTGTPTNVLNDRLQIMSSATGAAVFSGAFISNLAMMTQGSISVGLDADPNNTAGAGDTIFGQYIIGTFTRTSNDPLYLIIQAQHPLATNVSAPHINTLQIRETGLGGAAEQQFFCNFAHACARAGGGGGVEW